jgi:hypothetical protein
VGDPFTSQKKRELIPTHRREMAIADSKNHMPFPQFVSKTHPSSSQVNILVGIQTGNNQINHTITETM